MGEMGNTIFWLENLTGRDNFEDLGVEGEDNIKMDLREIEWEGVDASGSGYGPMSACCEYGNEKSGSIKGGNFLTS
jgi:hypothetical protein